MRFREKSLGSTLLEKLIPDIHWRRQTMGAEAGRRPLLPQPGLTVISSLRAGGPRVGLGPCTSCHAPLSPAEPCSQQLPSTVSLCRRSKVWPASAHWQPNVSVVLYLFQFFPHLSFLDNISKITTLIVSPLMCAVLSYCKFAHRHSTLRLCKQEMQ